MGIIRTVSIVLLVSLPCLGVAFLLIVYWCLFWYVTTHLRSVIRLPIKEVSETGLSQSELEKLPKVTGKELIMGNICVICLDETENEQPARLIPGCNHGFHVECADTWLSKHPSCPVCRAEIDAEFLNSTGNPC